VDLARLLEQRGYHEQAIIHYRRRASLAEPGDRFGLSAVVSCVRLLVKLGRRDAAVQCLREWLKKAPERDGVRTILAGLLYSLGRYKEAGQALEQLLLAKNPDASVLLVAALCSQALGKNQEARSYVRMAMGEGLPDPQTWDAIIFLLYVGIEVRRPLEGLLHSDEALCAAFDARLALGYASHARGLAGADEKTAALQACRMALKLAPDRADVQRAAGDVFRGLGMHEDYARCYSKAAELEPGRATHHGSLGWALYLAGRYDDAMAASLRALELDPKLAYVHANVGLLHVLERDLDKAMPSYEKAVELGLKQIDRIAIKDLGDLLKKQPETTEVHYALGFCYEKKGDKALAREHYQKYVDAAAEPEFVEKAKKRMADLSTK